MRLIHPSYNIMTNMLPISMYRTIEETGRTCYKSEDRITEDSAADFVARIIKSGHHSVIEHINISVRFTVDRGVSHELVRHRLASFSQESTRYCDYSKKGITFIIPPWVDIEDGDYTYKSNIKALPDPARTWYTMMLIAENAYNALLEMGWSPQQARTILPNSLKTEIVVTANLREWRHILELRTSPAAHPQMREVMCPLLAEFQAAMPEIFSDINRKDRGNVELIAQYDENQKEHHK